MKINSQISNDVHITADAVIPYFCNNKWSLHDLITHCLDYTGKAKVKISSFSISEAALRSFISNKENDLIHSFILLFDYTIPKRKFDLFLFAYDVFSEIRLASNHSKVILIDGDKNKLLILCSQNLTPNPRLESGVVITISHLYDFFSEHFDKHFLEAIPFNPYNDEP